jgi:phosphonoacetaldehyde hydrolase
MWTIGLAKTGNELGMTEEQVAAADPEILNAKLARAYQRMSQAGAHYVVDGIGDVMPALNDINGRLARGERP